MKKFLKYFFFIYMIASVVVISTGDENLELLGSMTFAISFLGWICIVTDRGSRRVEI